MAKYTELYSEWLENGGQIPAVFDQIEGFTNLFNDYYADYEIGFETPTLFALKLENKANIVIPFYVQKINAITDVKTSLQNPSKVRETVHNLGEINASNWVLPFNSNVAEPSAKAKTDAYINSDTETETGFTPDEIIKIFESLEKETNNIKADLLNEFKSLFMMIY